MFKMSPGPCALHGKVNACMDRTSAKMAAMCAEGGIE